MNTFLAHQIHNHQHDDCNEWIFVFLFFFCMSKIWFIRNGKNGNLMDRGVYMVKQLLLNWMNKNSLSQAYYEWLLVVWKWIIFATMIIIIANSNFNIQWVRVFVILRRLVLIHFSLLLFGLMWMNCRESRIHRIDQQIWKGNVNWTDVINRRSMIMKWLNTTENMANQRICRFFYSCGAENILSSHSITSE